jgi:hypothetical protein
VSEEYLLTCEGDPEAEELFVVSRVKAKVRADGALTLSRRIAKKWAGREAIVLVLARMKRVQSAVGYGTVPAE